MRSLARGVGTGLQSLVLGLLCGLAIWHLIALGSAVFRYEGF